MQEETEGKIIVIKNKIICIFVTVVLLVSVLCVPASAASNFTEYTKYSGFPISSSVQDILGGYAYNVMNDMTSTFYKHWVGIRVDEYKYLIMFFASMDDVTVSSSFTLNKGVAYVYDERMHSYVDDYRTYYQPGIYPVSLPCSVQISYLNVIGNIPQTMNSEAVAYSRLDYNNFTNIKNILYTLVAFLLLFVAFKFLNKRWLLP